MTISVHLIFNTVMKVFVRGRFTFRFWKKMCKKKKRWFHFSVIVCFPATAADILNAISLPLPSNFFLQSCSEVIILCFTSICYHRNDCNNLNLACLSYRIKQEDWMGCMWKNLCKNQNIVLVSKIYMLW